MKKHLLYLFYLGLLCTQCKKESPNLTGPLLGKWQYYLEAVSYRGADACQYRSKPSDFYYQPSSFSACRKDDIWQFSTDKVTRLSGKEKCTPAEPDQQVLLYLKTDSTLTIDGTTFHIVMLSSDTLIIDNCVEVNNNIPGMPPVGPDPARIGIKLFRLR